VDLDAVDPELGLGVLGAVRLLGDGIDPITRLWIRRTISPARSADAVSP
jgi:hypothetical protein